MCFSIKSFSSIWIWSRTSIVLSLFLIFGQIRASLFLWNCPYKKRSAYEGSSSLNTVVYITCIVRGISFALFLVYFFFNSNSSYKKEQVKNSLTLKSPKNQEQCPSAKFTWFFVCFFSPYNNKILFANLKCSNIYRAIPQKAELIEAGS